MKPPVARKLTVRHTKLVCLTACFLATGGFKFLIISKCMHCLQDVKIPQEGEVGGYALKSHGNYIVDHGKSWKNL